MGQAASEAVRGLAVRAAEHDDLVRRDAVDEATAPVPAAPAEAADSGAGEDNSLAKPGTGVGNGPQKAENEPVITEQQAAKQPEGNVGGDGAPKVNGGSDQERD